VDNKDFVVCSMAFGNDQIKEKCKKCPHSKKHIKKIFCEKSHCGASVFELDYNHPKCISE
jgi:hypothetical protein